MKIFCPESKLFSDGFYKHCKVRGHLFTGAEGAELAIIGHMTKVNQEFLRNLGQLRHLISATTGTTHIDLRSIEDKDIRLVTLKDVFFRTTLSDIRSTSQIAILHLLTSFRGAQVTRYSNSFHLYDRREGREFRCSRTGIIGFGRVGRHICEGLAGLNVQNISYYDPNVDISYPDPLVGFSFSRPLETLLAECETIFICANEKNDKSPVLDIKHSIIPRHPLTIINVGRASSISPQFLLGLAESGLLRSYCTDVFYDETRSGADSVLLTTLEELGVLVYVSPHIGGYVRESLNIIENRIIEYIDMVLENNCI